MFQSRKLNLSPPRHRGVVKNWGRNSAISKAGGRFAASGTYAEQGTINAALFGGEYCTRGSSNVTLGSLATPAFLNAPYTVVIRFGLSAKPASALNLFNIYHATSANAGYIGVDTSGFIFAKINSATVVAIQGSVDICDGKLHTVALTYVSGEQWLFLDGVLVGTSSTTASIWVDRLRLDYAKAYSSPVVYVSVAGILQNTFSPALAQTLSENPWQLFAPVQRRIYFDAAASSAADLSGNTASSATASGTITQSVTLSGASIALSTADGVVNQTVSASGSAASVSFADGLATVTSTLAGDGLIEAFSSGIINQAQQLDAAAQAAASAAADLSAGGDLSGAAQSVSAAVGSLDLSVTISGSALSQALAQANLDVGGSGLSGDANAVATAQAALLVDLPLSGDAQVLVTGSSGVEIQQAISGAAAIVVGAQGDLTLTVIGLTGNAIAEALAGGSVAMTVSIDATALSQALAVAALSDASAMFSARVIEKYTLGPVRNYVMVGRARNYILSAS